MRRRVEFLAWIGARLGKPPGFERVARRIAPMERCASLPEICLVRDGMLFITRLGVPIGWHVAVFGSYEPELRQIVSGLLPPGGIAIDVGANVGWHTLLMSRLAGRQGRVLAIEPNPSVSAELRRNLQINRTQNVEVMVCAVGGAEGVLSLLAPAANEPGAASGHVVAAGETGPGVISAPARTLDAIVAEANVDRLDFIKLDIEGYEWPALRGGEKTIARFRPPIVFEFDVSYAPRGGGSSDVLSEFFFRFGYRLYSIGRNWAEHVEPGAWPDCTNMLALPSERAESVHQACAVRSRHDAG
jgi:FkbM family methyltransferase